MGPQSECWGRVKIMRDQLGKTFDGIICIGGEDWWYHNRGHFDFQIMRRMSRRWPVLFVNSLGVRMPSLADRSLFATRIKRKLKSLSRGVVRVESGFHVFSPLSVPGEVGQKVSNWALAPQIKLAARRAGIRNPLLWVHCPAGADLIDRLPHAAVIMQRTDRFEAFPEGDPELLGRQVSKIKSKADLIVYAAQHLADEEAFEVRRQLVVTHGVDVDAFQTAGRCPTAYPTEVTDIESPRVGFIGGIDAHTFDPELFCAVAKRLPHMNFVMVGASSLGSDWCPLHNVHQLGRQPYEQIARYMAAMDALIMPWNQGDWIKACNPIKLKEYLAVGRPVITTDFPALEPWRDLVSVANTADDFADAIQGALDTPFDASKAQARVQTETWDAKAQAVCDGILGLGLEYVAQPGYTQISKGKPEFSVAQS
jgi:glycosyltransferase involved in cell wall biosynthesis